MWPFTVDKNKKEEIPEYYIRKMFQMVVIGLTFTFLVYFLGYLTGYVTVT